MKAKTHIKLNISLPLELHAWVVRRQKDEQKKSRIAVVPLSGIIAECVESMMLQERSAALILNDEKTLPHPHPGGDVIEPPETLDSGFSPRKKIKYQTKRQANSSR